MEFLTEYGLFLAKSITVVIAIAIILIFSFGISQRGRQMDKGHIEVRSVNENLNMLTQNIKQVVELPDMRKKAIKLEKQQEKARQKERKKESEDGKERQRVYVLEFEGDLQASAVTGLREEITAILSVANEGDEVIVKLESPGGVVHGYGLAASQLKRISAKGLNLTVAVDKVAASGGYMMACIANRIVAAPFAVLGSIGVVAQLPNFHRFLKNKDVDIEVLTAGEYKRTLTMFGENTDKGRAKFLEELEDVHGLFKEFVSEHRPAVNIDAVSTGEAWYGKRAIEQNLVDELVTSDEYIIDKCTDCDVFQVRYVEHRSRVEKLLERFSTVTNWYQGNGLPRQELAAINSRKLEI